MTPRLLGVVLESLHLCNSKDLSHHSFEILIFLGPAPVAIIIFLANIIFSSLFFLITISLFLFNFALP